MRPGPLFTIFTPTRNRARVLHRVYESLVSQTLQDFEWLIIDNDSSDETTEVIAAWQTAGRIPIRYVRQENRGVHVSWNRAAHEANGELFLQFRSADTCVPDALERFLSHWNAIEPHRKSAFVGVTALAMDEHGTLIGSRYPADVFDSDSLETRYRHHVHGEKWGFQRTEVLRRFPLPEVEGYHGYMPEGLMWARIAREFRTRYVNDVLRVYWQDQATSVSRPARRAENALGGLLESEDFLVHDVRWLRHAPREVLARATKYTWCALEVGRGPLEQWRALGNGTARSLWLATLPAGIAVYLAERAGLGSLIDRLRTR